MKTMSNKKINIDPMAEAKKGKYFKQYSKEAEEKTRLAIEIFETREALKISQQELAKKANTSQKTISKIENGDMNVGFSLLNRIASVLDFNYINWSKIHDFYLPPLNMQFDSKTADNNKNRIEVKIREEVLNITSTN